MLFDAALVINFNGAIDSGLPVDRKADLVPGGGIHSSSRAGCQNDRVARVGMLIFLLKNSRGAS